MEWMKTYNSETDFKPETADFPKQRKQIEGIVLDKFVPRGISFNSQNCVKKQARFQMKKDTKISKSVVYLYH